MKRISFDLLCLCFIFSLLYFVFVLFCVCVYFGPIRLCSIRRLRCDDDDDADLDR